MSAAHCAIGEASQMLDAGAIADLTSEARTEPHALYQRLVLLLHDKR